MGFSQIVTGISVFVVGLLPASCHHKSATAKTAAAATSVSAGTNVNATDNSNSVLHDLGEVTLTNRNECCVQLGNGKECILNPKLTDKDNAEIVVTFESKTAGGKIHDMIVTQVDARNGEATEATLGDFQLTFTPNIVSE